MTDLAAWILERLAEDEAAAREPWLHVLEDVVRWFNDGRRADDWEDAEDPDDEKGLAKALMQIEYQRGTYARVLAQCAALRKIVELHHPLDDDPEPFCWHCASDEWPCPTLRALTTIWSDHPDYPQGDRP